LTGCNFIAGSGPLEHEHEFDIFSHESMRKVSNRQNGRDSWSFYDLSHLERRRSPTVSKYIILRLHRIGRPVLDCADNDEIVAAEGQRSVL